MTKLPASPTIDVGGLLGLVELVEKLTAVRNSEQEERAACPTEQFPPAASRQADPTELGAVATSQPQTSGGTTEHDSATSDSDGREQRYGSEGGR